MAKRIQSTNLSTKSMKIHPLKLLLLLLPLLTNIASAHYDPAMGRWLNRDPLAENGGFNLYGFVENDGVGQIDILGREPKPVNGGFAFTGHEGGIKDGFFRDMAGGQENANVGHGKTGKDLLEYLKVISKENCCIKNLRLASHGGVTGLGGGEPGRTGFFDAKTNQPDGNREWETVRVNELTEDQLERLAIFWIITKEEARERDRASPSGTTQVPQPMRPDANGRTTDDLAKEISNGSIKFCKPCKIFIHACSQSDAFAQRLSGVTGCSVVYGTAGCYPAKGNDPDRKWRNDKGFFEMRPDNTTPVRIGSSVLPPKL